MTHPLEAEGVIVVEVTATATHTLTGAQASGEGASEDGARTAALDALLALLEQMGGC